MTDDNTLTLDRLTILDPDGLLDEAQRIDILQAVRGLATRLPRRFESLRIRAESMRFPLRGRQVGFRVHLTTGYGAPLRLCNDATIEDIYLIAEVLEALIPELRA